MCTLMAWILWTSLTALWTLIQNAEAGSSYYTYSSVRSSGGTSPGPPKPHRPMERLNLWIDGEETKRFVGMPMEIFVIRESQVVSFLQEAYITQHLPVLPPEVHIVKLTWQATDDIYEYRFSDLRSLDPETLYDPLISIPAAGIVPRRRTDFQVTIPCTRKETAIASMYISLEIWNSRRQPIDGSPIRLHVRKRCISYEERTICDCQNGGRCNERGECECRPGYLGQQCQQVACLPECQNNGTCISPRKCECMKGYIGEHCEIPLCKRPCHNGGTCIGVAPDRCECTNGFYGNHCQHKTGQCGPACKNGGTCTKMNTCSCPNGYLGEFCQKSICRQSCGVHGRCVAPNVCACKRGWRGRLCHKTVNRVSRDRYDKRRKKRRKSEHGLWQSRRDRRRQLRKRERRRQKEHKV